MARLLVLSGKDKGKTYQFEGDASIGRSSANTVQISGMNVSRHHAKIVWEDDGHHLVNLGARNGLFLNAREVNNDLLQDGDEIGVGPAILLIYRTGNAPAPAGPVTQVVQGSPDVVVSDDVVAGDSMVTAEYAQLLQDHSAQLAEVGDSQAHARLAALHKVGMAINSLLELSQLRNAIAEVVLEQLRAERCVILQVDADGALKPVAAKSVAQTKTSSRDEIQISRRILDLCHVQSKAILSNDVQSDSRFEGSLSIEMSQIGSVLATPLRRPDRKLGVIYVDTLDNTRLFEDDDLRLLTTIAAVAATAIENAQIFTATRVENRNLRAALRSNLQIIGESEAIGKIFDTIAKVGPTDATVLIRGETGTGKELVAKALHDASSRKDRPFIAVNCAELSESLLSSELFGHEKGAFTGAIKQKPGKFELAHGGTLFLDEVGDISSTIQVALLRVLQERQFLRVGGIKQISVDVRIIAATNRDLEELIEERTFRQDLFYRLAVVPLVVPPLRERKEDLALLVHHFLNLFSKRNGKSVRGITPGAMAVLQGYPWPGNVRELQNVVERAVVLSDAEVLTAEDLPQDLKENKFFSEISGKIEEFDLALPEITRWIEKTCIERAILRTTKKVDLAKLLKVSRPTLDKKLKEYQISLD